MSQRKTLFLKNMFSQSCIRLIQLAFKNHNYIKLESVELGTVKFLVLVDLEDVLLNQLFADLGFEVVQDPDTELVEKAKVAAYEIVFKASNSSSLIRNSDYVSDKLQVPYDKISRVFSKVTGVKFEKYIIMLKMERAKEMMSSREYTVSEIAYIMGYSSVQYFSNQFKKVVGVTVSKFKEQPNAFRVPVNELV